MTVLEMRKRCASLCIQVTAEAGGLDKTSACDPQKRVKSRTSGNNINKWIRGQEPAKKTEKKVKEMGGKQDERTHRRRVLRWKEEATMPHVI